MKSLADQLPPEIAQQIHPDWRKNEADYWAMRDQLLGQFQGQWIGFANGAVIACGTRPVIVFHAAHQAAEHPFVTCVGRENEPTRMRRMSFPYSAASTASATSPVFVVPPKSDDSDCCWLTRRDLGGPMPSACS